jgi:DNA-binding MarR family transcriptional regulator
MPAQPDTQTDPLVVADAAASFVKAFDAWTRRTSVANAGESESRLRLLYELHCNGPRKMADLADTLGVTPRSITALVDGLEAESLVRRSGHPTDRRVTMIELTGGATTVQEQFDSFQAALAGLFADLSEADRRALVRLLTRLEARIAEPPAAGSGAG